VVITKNSYLHLNQCLKFFSFFEDRMDKFMLDIDFEIFGMAFRFLVVQRRSTV